MGLKNASKYGFVVLTALSLSAPAFAQAKKAGPVAPPAAAPKEDKVDISDLENKYWAPKDTDFSVVQNRTYSKIGKFAISPMWGTPINDPHSEGNMLGVLANYFWSERMGVQLTYIAADLNDNEATGDIAKLSAVSGARPNFGRLSSAWSIGYNFVPFYAKMSVWGKKIIYFDMAFTPHIGMTTFDKQIEGGNKSDSALTYGIDVTQLFFFSKAMAIRVDLRNQWHQEEIVRYRGGAGAGTKDHDTMTHDTMFLIGPMFYW